MFEAMKKYLELPELYKETEVAFWDDDYISAQMLKAHLAPDGGFWCEEEYLVLNRNYKYSDNVTLEQSIVVSNNTITSYYLWNSCFTIESLTKEAKEAGFEVCGIYGDVAGSRYTEESPTIAVV